jgi:cysteine desulfurase
MRGFNTQREVIELCALSCIYLGGKSLIYLDNAATTKPSEAAVQAAHAAMVNFGNPSSLHGAGLTAEKAVEGTRRIIAQEMGVKAKHIYFTSGGTEANNTAVFGTAYRLAPRGRHVITTKIEHPSVLEPFKMLEKKGFDVTYLDVNSDGVVNLEQMADSLNENTTFVSVMHVNNETGVIQPVEQIKEIIRKKSPNALFHVDAVQSFGKLPVQPLKWGADLLSVSAHKVHGLKGTGALYIADGVHINPLLHGGGQQSGVRPGTENTAGIAAFGAAISEFDTSVAFSYMTELRNFMKKRLIDEIPDIKINGSDRYSAGSVLNASFIGIKAEILLHALEARGVYVSTGSACSAHHPAPSHVLTAMGCTRGEIMGAVRFSFERAVTIEDINEAVDIIREEAARIPKIR